MAEQPDLHPLSPENIKNPSSLYKKLRESAPVYWCEPLNGWILTRHDDVSACFRDSRFSANRVAFFEAQVDFMGLKRDTIKDYLEIAPRQMLMKDGVDHVRMRRKTMAAFTPEELASWRPTIHRTMEMLVERVRSRGRMDLVTEISHQFPPLVIAELLGIPLEHRERFQDWSEPLAQFNGPGLDVDM
ncbi:MAG TPA: cytochrome P450, partial [Archangium sp.]